MKASIWVPKLSSSMPNLGTQAALGYYLMELMIMGVVLVPLSFGIR
uniref:Uncharacterized protein n=1 Tax=Rhizophora mucronata TaxID=61149 RepID=A0A2P2IIZ7_RHIMU